MNEIGLFEKIKNKEELSFDELYYLKSKLTDTKEIMSLSKKVKIEEEPVKEFFPESDKVFKAAELAKLLDNLVKQKKCMLNTLIDSTFTRGTESINSRVLRDKYVSADIYYIFRFLNDNKKPEEEVTGEISTYKHGAEWKGAVGNLSSVLLKDNKIVFNFSIKN